MTTNSEINEPLYKQVDGCTSSHCLELFLVVFVTNKPFSVICRHPRKSTINLFA